MVSQFAFVTDTDSEAYCLKIVASLIRQFGITREEAIGRVNRAFLGQSLLGPMDWVYHEIPDDQARFIYYKSGVHWWLEGADLSPSPYPYTYYTRGPTMRCSRRHRCDCLCKFGWLCVRCRG
jgi:hypothetical protein